MNPLRGQVKVILEGQEYILSSTFKASVAVESVANAGLPTIANRIIKEKDVRVTDIVAIIYGGLIGAGVMKYSFDQLGELVCDSGMGEYSAASVELLGYMVSKREIAEAEKKPEADPSIKT